MNRKTRKLYEITVKNLLKSHFPKSKWVFKRGKFYCEYKNTDKQIHEPSFYMVFYDNVKLQKNYKGKNK